MITCILRNSSNKQTKIPSIIVLISLSIFVAFISPTQQAQYTSNFNVSNVLESTTGDATPLPIILHPADHRINNRNNKFVRSQISNENVNSMNGSSKIQRYQLKDTNYNPELRDLTEFQRSILYSTEPPAGLFDIPRTVVLQSYQLLEQKSIKITLINPTDHFKFCLTEVYSDNESVKRIEHRRLPFCLNPNNKYPFFFNIYIVEAKPTAFRSTVYFLVEIYDGDKLADSKVWPKQILVKVAPNHLKIGPVQARNCGANKNFTNISIPNPHSHHIKVSFDNQFQINSQDKSQKEVMIPSQKFFKMQVPSKQSIITLHARVYESSLFNEVSYPRLYLPVYCVKSLQLDYFNIGILSSDRSTIQIVVPASNFAKQTIQVKSIEVKSSGQNVQIQSIDIGQGIKIPASVQHASICKLLIHASKNPAEFNNIQVKVTYFFQSNPKQIMQVRNSYAYLQVKNPLSMSGRRFVDVTKPVSNNQDPVQQHIFPIRNNLNIPLLLIRVVYSEQLFKLTYMKDRRQYIYPNQQQKQFSLQYIGPRKLAISPKKYIIILQFNGNLLVPVQIVLYDHTLQCITNDIQQKCSSMPPIDYGYFWNNASKFKQLTIRNWNPVDKEIKIRFIQDNSAQKFGMNFTFNLLGPYPEYDMMIKRQEGNVLYFYLKGNHFVIINVGLTPLSNCTSGEMAFQINTTDQSITKKFKFKIQNKTIALIPQILRINSAYENVIEYLNLVSTFSEPYRIKSTFINSSNIKIYYNNHSQIYENQWIGLALIYNPFTSNISTTASTSCCSKQYFSNSFVPSLYTGLSDFKQFTYLLVRVVTTTELEVNSTIIINNTPPKIIQQENISISLINSHGVGSFNVDDKPQIKNIKTHKRNNYMSNQRQNHQNQQSAQQTSLQNGISHVDNSRYHIKIKNIFKENMKYCPVLIPRVLYEDTKPYILALRRMRKTYEDAHLCVNNAVAIKHNFSPQMVKSMFSLDAIPQQLTIQPLQNDQYYITGSTNRRVSSQSSSSGSATSHNTTITSYIRKTVNNGARLCYKFNASKIVKQLIQTHILNDIAESSSTEILHQFVQKQIEHYNAYSHYLEHDDFYNAISQWDISAYCNRSVYVYFRFCRQISVIIKTNNSYYVDGNNVNANRAKQSVLAPGHHDFITFTVSSRAREHVQSFYLVLLNNITKYQVHSVQVSITSPKLKLTKVYFPATEYVNKMSKNLLKNDDSSLKDYKEWSKSPVQLIKKHFTKKQLQKLSTHVKQIIFKQNQTKESVRQLILSTIPIILPHSQQFSALQYIYQTITVLNSGNIDIHISHFGFENQQYICGLSGIDVLNQNQTNDMLSASSKQHQDQLNKANVQQCAGFTIRKGQQKNLTLRVSRELTDRQGVSAINLYMYSAQNYHFRLLIMVKGAKGRQSTNSGDVERGLISSSIKYIFVSSVSFLYVLAVIFKFKRELDQKEQIKKDSVKSKVMPTSMYHFLGTKLEKKKRKIESIPQEDINAVKQFQQSRIKQFFNSSSQSQIAKRHHTEEQQPSNNQILSALKQNDRNNMSISEGESSIDFIDLNALNKSSIGHSNQVQVDAEDDKQQKRVLTKSMDIQEELEKNQERQNKTEQAEQEEQEQEQEESQGNNSDADSNFTDGDAVDYSSVKQDFGWGDPSQQRKKKREEQGNSYYNVFFSQNPLKKSENTAGLFHWMNNDHQRHHR